MFKKDQNGGKRNVRWGCLLRKLKKTVPELYQAVKTVRDNNLVQNKGNRKSLTGCGKAEVELNNQFWNYLAPSLQVGYKCFLLQTQEQSNRKYGMNRLGGTLTTSQQGHAGEYDLFFLSYESYRNKMKPREATKKKKRSVTKAVKSQHVPLPTHLLPSPSLPTITEEHLGHTFVLTELKVRKDNNKRRSEKQQKN